MSNRNICLHIGINNYEGYGPGHDLEGSVNDAKAWSKLMRNSGVPKDHVTVLLDGKATHEAIKKAVKAVGDAVAEGTRKNKPISGLITFSGHGVATASTGTNGIGVTAGICPSDVKREGHKVHHVISVGELEKWLGLGGANTTIVLDACYSTATDDGGQPLTTAELGRHELTHVSSRLILGAQPWQESFQVQVGEKWRGALSFAMVTLLSQWTVGSADGALWFNVSYGDLIHRAHQLLGVLGLSQTPMLLGPPRYVMIPMLRPGLAISAGETSPTPDKVRRGSQLSHGSTGDVRTYSLYAERTGGASILLARVLVVRNTGSKVINGVTHTFSADTEYWYPVDVPTSDLFTSTGASRVVKFILKLSSADQTWANFTPWSGMSGGGVPDSIASSYTTGSWPPAAMAGSALGTRAYTSGARCVPALSVTVNKTSSTSTLMEVVWFSNTAETNTTGWTGNWKKGSTATFGTSTDPSSAGWAWYLKVY